MEITNNIEYWKYSLEEIEQLLNIKSTTEEIIIKINESEKKRIKFETFDDWNELEEKLKDLRNRETTYTDATIYGYELVGDNHYIRLYYEINVYNT